MMSKAAIIRCRQALELASQLRSPIFRSPTTPFPFSFCNFSHANEVKESLFLSFLRRDLGFSESEIVVVNRRYPRHSQTESIVNARNVFLLLRQWGHNDSQIRKIILDIPQILAAKPDRIESKLQLLESVGLNPSELSRLISQSPRSLTLSLEKSLLPRIRFFQNILQGNSNFLKVLRKNSRLLSYNTEKRLIPLVEFLSESGIKGDLLVRLIKRNTRIVTVSIDSLKAYMEFVRKMGIEEPSERFVDATVLVSSVRSVQKVEERLRLLESIGVHRNDVISIFKKFPYALMSSNEKIYRNVQYLTQVIGLPPDILVRCPVFLAYSLERRIKPRYEVFKYLRGINPSYENSKLTGLLTISNEKFISSHVKPSPNAEALLKILDTKTESR